MSTNRAYAIVAVGMVLMVAYGSLYPFDFSQPATGLGPIHTLLGSWADRPGRSDFIANILLYMPLGFFIALGMPFAFGAASRFSVTLLVGAVLSVSLELVQYYDVGRDTAATDVYANFLGTAFGAIAAIIFRHKLRWPVVHQVIANPIPALLVSAWVGYRLYPFVPTTDLHKWWHTIKPMVLSPTLSPSDLFRQTAIWLVVYVLVAKLSGRRRPWLLLLLFAGGVLCSKIIIVAASLRLAEVGGAIIAYVIWVALSPFRRAHLVVTTVIFALVVVAQRLEPFHFLAYPVPFSWIPFRSFMYGSIAVNVMSFFEKFFLYGSLIWLLTEIRIKRATATGLVTVTLLATSIAETHLPQRSAEVTDSVMALVIAVIFALITIAMGRQSPRLESCARDDSD